MNRVVRLKWNSGKGLLRYLLLLAAIPLGGCLKTIPMDPDLQAEFRKRDENLVLEFQTDKGRQLAYYLPPFQDPAKPPEKIAILYPGINTLALGWLRYIEPRDYPATAFLLIEYPGRGLNEGTMRPEENYKNTLAALDALARRFNRTRISASFSLLGHSFGSGMALQFASIRDVERIILVAPFNDLKQAVSRKSHLLALLMPSQIDNRQLVKKLLEADDPPEITIFHGARDKTLPISMGRELAQIAPQQIDFRSYAEDDHVNILSRRHQQIFDTLTGAPD